MQVYILNILVIVESVLLLVTSFILFSKTKNLTKLKKYEEALINAQADRQAKQNDFFPMLVHELRAPLSVIQGAADLLIKSTDSLNAEQIHTLLNQIKISSSSLLKMVGDILDVSKMEGGKFQINKTYGSIDDVLKEQCSYFEPVAQVKGVTLSCPNSGRLPNFSFDPERIKQVLNNLLSNAIKFSSKGSSVTVTSKKDSGFVRIEVSDNGVGIVDKDKPLLFQKFFQASNRNEIKEKGTGLGLVIAKGVVEAHGGKIWIEDNKPKGSKFIFTLPL
ncbi:MAG: HAMP domain-containing sensor histidine kinase [Patescibacteria group bacterium]